MPDMEETIKLMKAFIKAHEENDREALSRIDLSALPDMRVMEAFVKAHEEVKQKIKESEAREREE